jgi:tRNA threonylcarbamoyl adenosine modification protein (Sua5/YciO/YrdC/YwlC family)
VRRLPFHEDADAVAAGRAVAAVVAGGGVVLLPTETFYGLAANPLDHVAVSRVLAAKGRPAELALPVLCSDWQQLEALVEVPEVHRPRLSRIWPGALTVVLPCRQLLAAAPAGTLAVRIPGHAMLRAVLYRAGPLTGTSANRHGSPPCIDPDEALASVLEPPDLVLDGGRTPGGSASTLVDLTGAEPHVLREGALAWQEPYPWNASG